MPPEVKAAGDGVALLVVMLTLGAAALTVAFTLAIRSRDPLPVLACIGALVAVINEPIYDLLGKIVYASNQPRAFTAFDRHIPLFLIGGYLPWVGLLPVLLARRMRRGIQRRTLCRFAAASFLSVAIVESLGTRTGGWAYYGNPPLKYLGVAPQMAPMPIVCAWLLLTIGPRLRGWAKALVILIPPVALGAVYAASSWPMYVALNSNAPAFVDYVAGATTLGLCAAIVWTVATAVAPIEREKEYASEAEAVTPVPL